MNQGPLVLDLTKVDECTNTKRCFIRNLVRIGRGLYSLDQFEFFLLYQIFKFRCIHEASFVRKPKSSNILFSKKELKEIDEEAIWEP